MLTTCLDVSIQRMAIFKEPVKADKMISNVYCIKEANIYLKQTKT